MIFEDIKLWSLKDEVPQDPDYLVPIGKAHVRRTGTDVTIVAIAGAMRSALDAATSLASEGISAEVIDPRTLKPLDTETIVASVAKTGRLLIVENAHRVASASAEIAAVVAEEAFESLRRPILRLTAPDVHVPFTPVLEKKLFPNKAGIVAAAQQLCHRNSTSW
jgi:pyruvate dehydrogenase E1 component beta subunit